jgi:DNA-binding response OmpR family regulator
LRAAAANAFGDTPDGREMKVEGMTFDRSGQRLISGDAAQHLTPIEFRLLDYLVSVRGAIATTSELLENVWHYEAATASSDVVRSHMKNLRAKIRALAGADLIETIPRRGYRLV